MVNCLVPWHISLLNFIHSVFWLFMMVDKKKKKKKFAVSVCRAQSDSTEHNDTAVEQQEQPAEEEAEC